MRNAVIRTCEELDVELTANGPGKVGGSIRHFLLLLIVLRRGHNRLCGSVRMRHVDLSPIGRGKRLEWFVDTGGNDQKVQATPSPLKSRLALLCSPKLCFQRSESLFVLCIAKKKNRGRTGKTQKIKFHLVKLCVSQFHIS